MPTLQSIYQELKLSIDSSSALYQHCLNPTGLHTSAGIEAAFLQIQKSWELFLEDFLLSALTGEKPLTIPINCYFQVNDIEIARKIILQEKKYLDWVFRDYIIKRLETYIEVATPFVAIINSIAGELNEISILRNRIAHSSKKAKNDFANLWQRRVGGNPTITNVADFLLLKDPQNPTDTYFEKYAKILDISASQMVS